MQQKHVLLQLLKNKAFMQFYKTDIFSGVFRWWRTPRHGRPSFRLRRRWRRSSRRRFPVILIPVRLVVLLIYPTVPLLTHIGKSVRLPACSAATAPPPAPVNYVIYISVRRRPPPSCRHMVAARARHIAARLVVLLMAMTQNSCFSLWSPPPCLLCFVVILTGQFQNFS